MGNVGKHLLAFCALFLASISLGTATESCTPAQIRLSFGDLYATVSQSDNLESLMETLNDNQAYLVWQSESGCEFQVNISDVEDPQKQMIRPFFTPHSYSHEFSTEGSPVTYESTAYIALLDGLEYEHAYQYTIVRVSDGLVTGPFKFRLATANVTDSPKKVFFVGNTDNTEKGNVTLDRIKSEFKKNPDNYAGLIHLGDLAYNLEDDNGKKGDSLLSSIQDITASLPFIMTPGNDDQFDEWKLLNFRLRNPLYDTTSNQYFSFNLQGIHFLSINFEYYSKGDEVIQKEMLDWITSDLELSNEKEHRALWPWVVVISHQSLYCAYSDPDCPVSQECYTYYAKMTSWDELFHKHSVDLMVSGHLHNYERMTPIYKNQSVGQGHPSEIINPKATVYINEGVGGSRGHGPETYTAQGYGVMVNKTSGYGALLATKTSSGDLTLIYEHYSSETGQLIDTMQITRSNGAPAPALEGDHHLILTIALIAGSIGLVVAIVVLKKCKFGKIAEDNVPLNPSSPMRSNKLRYNRPGERGLAMVDL